MAAEVAQYLQNQFLTSLEEAESELSGSVNLLSDFKEIKDILEKDREVISIPKGGAVESLLCYLSQLNYALVECRNVANKCKERNKKLLLFDKPFMVYFILRMKRRLTTLKNNFQKYFKYVKSLREMAREREMEGDWERERGGRGRGGRAAWEAEEAMEAARKDVPVESVLAAVAAVKAAKAAKATKAAMEAAAREAEVRKAKEAREAEVRKAKAAREAEAREAAWEAEVRKAKAVREAVAAAAWEAVAARMMVWEEAMEAARKDALVESVLAAVAAAMAAMEAAAREAEVRKAKAAREEAAAREAAAREAEAAREAAWEAAREAAVAAREAAAREAAAGAAAAARKAEAAWEAVAARTRVWEEFGVHVFGFYEKAKKIEGMLFGSEAGIGFSAIGIVGIAGAGKTTLVRKVLDIKRVWYEFSPIIQLCPSDIIKEETKFTRAVSISIVTSILEQLGDNVNDDTDQEEAIRLGKHLKRLNQLLQGKKYLIVLDDVWHMNDFYSDLAGAGGVEDDNTWDRLSHGLPKDRGGAVMVTTRITRVARGMVGDQKNLILVEQLDRESCWRIFMASIPDQYLTDSIRETLEKIKNEIQDRSLGLPLAAKTLAKFIPEKISRIQD